VFGKNTKRERLQTTMIGFVNRSWRGGKILAWVLVVVLFVLPILSIPEYAYADGCAATGGTITTDGDYTVHTFNSSGTFEITSGTCDVEYLVVGGGGGGGSVSGGGGGAGGFLTGTLNRGVGSYTVTIGAGGAGGISYTTEGENGEDSVFDNITATGGGRGANVAAVGTGGSGGGGSSNESPYTGGAGTVGQGYDGGTVQTPGVSPYSSAGGGGGSEVGEDASGSVAGSGGDGLQSSITGVSTYYSGGGGGGKYYSGGTVGAGGAGGGGGGGQNGAAGTAGTPNTGGGGGGGGSNGTSWPNGGNGGSGIVILRYLAEVILPDTTFTTDVTDLSNFTITGSVTKGSGTFVIDHPLDPKNKLLFHSFVESPDVKNIYDGIVRLDKNGEVTIQLPEYFEALNKDFRYQVKGLDVAMPNIHIKEEVRNNRFVIGGGAPLGRASWQVTGIRHDPYILANPIVPEVKKGRAERVKKGEFIFKGYEATATLPLVRPFLELLSRLFR